MQMLSRGSTLRVLALVALVTGGIATAAPAASRAPIRDCGDLGDASDAGAYAITAQGRGLTCATARGVARAVPRKASCRTQANCTVRGFVCLVPQAGKELWLANCESLSTATTKVVRFEFGS